MLDVIVGRALDDGMLAALQSREPQLPGVAQNERVSTGPEVKWKCQEEPLTLTKTCLCSAPCHVQAPSECCCAADV